MPPPRPHPLARSRFAAMADRAMAHSWRFNDKPPLDPEYIWRKGSKGFDTADEAGGRPPEDVADFRARLAELCASLREEAQLNALGHAMAYGQLKAAVRTRHALGRLWRQRPELPRTPIAPPIIVVGQMRSGTTRLHRLLAADPRHAFTRLCDSIEPAPRRPDTRPLRCAAGLAVARRINPWLDTLHPFGATRPDEELGWLASALDHCIYEAQYAVPAFVAFSEARDAAPVYREFGRIFRTDAAVRGNAARARVLKCPQYAEDLGDVLAQFPDARVAVARRDLSDVLASTVSVVASQMAYQSDRIALPGIVREWQRKLDLREDRMATDLASFRGPCAEVAFVDLDRDWRTEIARVYAELGLDLAPEAVSSMTREQTHADASAYRLHAGTYRRFGTR